MTQPSTVRRTTRTAAPTIIRRVSRKSQQMKTRAWPRSSEASRKSYFGGDDLIDIVVIKTVYSLFIVRFKVIGIM